jgi:hypothetical protein
MVWAACRAIFSQTHLVTLPAFNASLGVISAVSKEVVDAAFHVSVKKNDNRGFNF